MIEKILEEFNNKNGFIKHNNITIKSVSEDEVVAEINLSDISNNPYGITHGGLIYSLADTACGVHVFASAKRKAVTLNSQISFLKASKGKKLIAKTEIIKNGKSISIIRCNIYNEDDDLISTCDCTYYFIN